MHTGLLLYNTFDRHWQIKSENDVRWLKHLYASSWEEITNCAFCSLSWGTCWEAVTWIWVPVSHLCRNPVPVSLDNPQNTLSTFFHSGFVVSLAQEYSSTETHWNNSTSSTHCAGWQPETERKKKKKKNQICMATKQQWKMTIYVLFFIICLKRL